MWDFDPVFTFFFRNVTLRIAHAPSVGCGGGIIKCCTQYDELFSLISTLSSSADNYEKSAPQGVLLKKRRFSCT